jgi:hypothetical protein
MGFEWVLAYFRNSINQLIFVMVKSCVFFAVRTEFLNRYYLETSCALLYYDVLLLQMYWTYQ